MSVFMATVLIVDRHHGLFQGIRGLLETTFSKVFLVTDKASLIEGAARLQPTVIVMDLFYAEGNLTDVVSELRHHAPAAKVLLLSVHDEPTVIASAMEAGADGLVVKRAIAMDLMPAIDAILVGKHYFPSMPAI
jgi:DNA-binding NarL/FixJ family response regulator